MCRNLNKKRLHFCEKCSLYLIMCPGFQICVGVDAHIDPLGTIEFAEDFRKTGFFRRGDVGIDPYGFQAKLIQIRQNPERLAFRIFLPLKKRLSRGG